MATPSVAPTPEVVQSLPCRGCQQTCVNYGHCNGKLWRMDENLALKSIKACLK